MNSHCQCPLWVQILAGLAFAYLIASVIYIMVTRRSDTPFKNSLSPEQIAIKKESIRQRGRIFGIGFSIGLVIMTVVIIMCNKRV